MQKDQTKYQPILRNWKYRIILGTASGFIFKLLVDVIFGLLYRNYAILKPINNYFGVIILSLIVVEIFNTISKALDRTKAWDTEPKYRFYTQLATHSMVAIFFFGIVRWLIEYIILGQRVYILKNELIIIISTLLITLLYNGIELGVFLLYKWRYSLAELERFKKENAEFKFETLRNQVNPHFLFNSLNTLSSVMYENVDTAASYIRQLSQVYRYVLENRDKELIELDKELEFIKAYKYLFELRFTNRLKISLPEVNNNGFLIAPMTIQMLIENAVKHNIISQNKPLSINIEIQDKALKVKNNLQKKAPEGYSSGMGLINIQSRYEFLSNKKVLINETEKEFIVEIPLIEKTL